MEVRLIDRQSRTKSTKTRIQRERGETTAETPTAPTPTRTTTQPIYLLYTNSKYNPQIVRFAISIDSIPG